MLLGFLLINQGRNFSYSFCNKGRRRYSVPEMLDWAFLWILIKRDKICAFGMLA